MATDNPNDRIEPGTLPAHGAKMLDEIYERELADGRPKKRAAEIAWGVVKKHYYKRGKKWQRRKRALKAGEEAPQYSDNPQENPAAPSLADLGTVVELGRVRELVVDDGKGEHKVYTWKGKRPRLLYSKPKHMLFWVEGAEPSNPKRGAPRGDGAAKVFENFAAQDATSHRTMGLPPKRLRRVGRAVSIAYTEPYGRHPRKGGVWEHEFSPSDTFYQAGRSSPFVFAVAGPRLTVTDRGIVY